MLMGKHINLSGSRDVADLAHETSSSGLSREGDSSPQVPPTTVSCSGSSSEERLSAGFKVGTTLLSGNVYPMYCGRVLRRDLRRQSPPQHSLGKRLALRQASRLPLSDWLSCPAQPVYLYTVGLQLSRLNSHHACYRLQSIIATKPHPSRPATKPHHARYQASKLQ
ncbi:hypothetical protein E2C01_088524 [Portunus trituberculatus]|uniref:Uncharacterized protein n=1 Tax=Portunus trituberculatus TaxID=210409 RepID=A0A5B7JK44_PORTR|nr:hypothetical protein [Portunus trituberculatus]